MRNLRKFTAAILAVALVLTSMTAAFAAETATTPVNGEKAIVLNDLGLYAGIDKDVFNPDLGSQLTRQQSTVLLLKMFGLADKAAALTKEEVATALKGYTDAKKVSTWAENSIAYAVTNNIMSGIDGTISPNANVTGAQFATLIVKTMGYDVPDYKLAVTQLSKVTGSKVADEFADADLTRDGAVGYMYGALTAQTKAGATVIANLVAGNPAIADKAIAKGLYTPVNTTLVVDSVIAVANNKVKVELTEAAAATAADFAIVKKGTTTAVAVKNVVKESDKLYVLETEALVGGTTYTLTANAKSVNFTGIKADTTAPKVNKVSGKDTNTFEVEYSDKMDFATVTDIANYTFDKSIKVVKAELNGDRNVVTITTDAAKRGTIYTLTVQKVANSDGKVIAKANIRVTAVEDKQIPRVANPKVQNNRMIVLTFTDANGMSKDSLETLSNYSINDLGVLSAKAYDVLGDDDGKYETVVLTTETQTSNKSYTLTMENLVDGSVLANPLGKTARTFRGAPEDKTLPTVKPGSVRSSNNNEVTVEFVDNNAMDITSIEDVSNYSITATNGDVLEVLSAKAAETAYPNMYSNKKVTLTTAPQDSANYKLEVKGVQDEFGNALKATGKFTFAKSNTDAEAPRVIKVEYKSDTRVDLTFSESLKESIAEDPTNYSINNDVGAPIKATLKEDVRVELTTQALTSNKKYEVTINNIEDAHGNPVRTDTKCPFTSRATDLDLTAPGMTYIQAISNQEIQITFDESVKTVPLNITLMKVDPANRDAWAAGASSINFTKAGIIDGGKTVIYVTTGTARLTNTNNESYKISSTNNDVFADEAGNKINAYSVTPTVTPAMSDRLEISGTDASNVDPEVSYIEQINVNKIKVVFTKPVRAITPLTTESSKLKKIDDVSDEYLSEWYYDNGTKFGVKDVTLYFSNIAIDAVGKRVVDLDGAKGSTFSANLEDSTGPVITGVEAINRRTIEVSYDEDLSIGGTYKVYKQNPSNNRNELFGTWTSSKDDSKAIVTTDKDLTSSDIFYLETIVPAKDIATNKEDISSKTQYDFYGSDLQVSDFVAGVIIINANTIKVTGTSDITRVVNVTDTSTSSSAIGIIAKTTDAGITVDDVSIDGKDATITLAVPVLSGTNYTVDVIIKGQLYSYTFDGITPDMNIGLKADGTLEFLASETGLYNFAAYSIDAVGTKIPGVIQLDGSVKFAGIISGNKYYVVATKKDGTAGVVYAAVVKVPNP